MFYNKKYKMLLCKKKKKKERKERKKERKGFELKTNFSYV